jgi:cytochrome c551
MRLGLALLLIFGALALVAAGCGGEETAPLPEEVEGDVPTETAATETEDDGEDGDTGEDGGEGDEDAGEQVFASGGCGSCHTFEEAGSSGTIGPSFDETDTSFEEAVETITNGRGGMPAFSGQLSEQEIRDVAAFVSDD